MLKKEIAKYPFKKETKKEITLRLIMFSFGHQPTWIVGRLFHNLIWFLDFIQLNFNNQNDSIQERIFGNPKICVDNKKSYDIDFTVLIVSKLNSQNQKPG